MRDFIRGVLLVMFATLAWLAHGCAKSDVVSTETAALVSIAIAPANVVIPTGFQESFRASGTFSDGATRDLTADVTWQVSPPDVAGVSNAASDRGLISSLAPGIAIVTATMGDVVGTTSLRATAAQLVSISVSPFRSSIPVGLAQQFAAVGIFDDQSMREITAEAAWASSTPAVAAVSSAGGSRGMVTTNQAGMVTLSANLFAVTGSTPLEVTSAGLVSISLEPHDPAIAMGLTEQFTATGIFTDGSSQDLTAQADWTSSAPAIAAISNDAGSKGRVWGEAVGGAVISASFGNVSATTAFTVSAASLQSLSITPARPSVVKGLLQQFRVDGTFSDNSTHDLTAEATWASSAAGVATVSGDLGSVGLVTAIDVGSAEISASFGGMSASTTLTVGAAALTSLSITPANLAAAVGLVQELHAGGVFSDDTTQDLTAQATWSSSAAAVAGVSNVKGSRGSVTAVGAGSAVITAAFGGLQASTNLTVSAATPTSLSITPANPSVALGSAEQFHVTGTFSDGTTADLTGQATWTSSTALLAVISNALGSKGLVTALGLGATTITASYAGFRASTMLVITL